MAGKARASQMQAPLESAEPDTAEPDRAEPDRAEPGEISAQPWWRRHRSLVAVVACLAAVPVGIALLAPDRVEDILGDRGGGAPADVEHSRDTANDDAPGASERRDGSSTPGDTAQPAPTEPRDPQPQQPETAPRPPEEAVGTGEAGSPNLDITPAAFRDRWNVAVGDLGRGYLLDEIVVDDSDSGGQPGGEMVDYPIQQPMEAFGFIEVLIRPDGLVSSTVIEGEPTGEQQGDYVATLAAAVAAATGLNAQEAADLLETDLGLDRTVDPASHAAGTEVGGVVIQIEVASGIWSFYIGGPWTG